ncbi:MAG TPA: CoA ester lyase, partial [Candidatus Dormibacteraeota bacterium]|nr:CoA ester lyase [Candidatus Dormibacteraeota bacterium]
MRSRRSVLSMPADRARFHDKAQDIAADELIFDLEDSVVASAKEAAREQMVDSLRRFAYPGKTVAVRVNVRGSMWFEADVDAARGCARVDSLVIPKVASAAEVRELELVISGAGRPLALELQIESASGLEHAGEIAAASSLVEVLHFGPFDLAATLGASVAGSEIPDEIYVHGLIQTLVAARAAGRQAVDGPFSDLHDAAGLERSARRAARLGCDGKWAIHPDQV